MRSSVPIGSTPMRIHSLIDGLSRLQQRHALLLFLALGAALFTVDGLRQRTPALQPPQVAGGDDGAAQWLEDEVLYREAKARGLDDGDLIVRRRLVQKMRLLLETGVDVAEPDEAALRRWVDTHAARYGGTARLSLDHVFLSRARRGERLAADAETMAARLQTAAPADLAALGDPHPAGTRVEHASLRDAERLFGTALTRQLAELPQQDWQGPLASALGLHFVRVRGREVMAPDYAAVREPALRDYLIEQRRLRTQLALDELKARYGVGSASAFR